MKKGYIIAGMAFLLIAGVSAAGYHATTISSDGFMMLKSSGSDENGIVVSRVMTVDDARISRTTEEDQDIEEDLSVSGTGPVIFDGFVSGNTRIPDKISRCSFLDDQNEKIIGEASGVVSGILQNGDVEISRTGGESISGMTAVNGSGMVYLGSQVTGKRSKAGRSFVTGNMTLIDLFRYGGKI